MPPTGDGMETIMKLNKKKLFINIFLRSMIIVLLLITAGFISYYTVMLYWHPKNENVRNAYQESTQVEKVTVIGSDNMSKNLMFSYNKQTNEIEAVVLEILNCNKKEITYLTLPVRMQITMAPAIYQKMVLSNPEMPQIMKLSAMPDYIDFKKSAQDGVRIIEGILDSKINYYTVIPSDIYKDMFLEKTVKQNDNNDSVMKYVFKWNYQKSLNNLKTEDDLKNYINKNYSKALSNLELKDKLSLVQYYHEIKSDNLHFEVIKGTNTNNGYMTESTVIQQQLSQLIGK